MSRAPPSVRSCCGVCNQRRVTCVNLPPLCPSVHSVILNWPMASCWWTGPAHTGASYLHGPAAAASDACNAGAITAK